MKKLLFILFEGVAFGQAVSFIRRQDIAVGPACCLVVAGDFDGDGKADLAVAYGPPGQGSVVFMAGDGTGGFARPVLVAIFSATVTRILASDVNRDKRLDLLVQAGPQTYLLAGRGDGTFVAPVATGVDYLAGVADFNNDGIPDLLSTYSNTCYEVQLGNGDGTFRAPPAGCVTGDSYITNNFAVGDLNRDGKLDLAWAPGRSDQNVWTYLGGGDGTLRFFDWPFTFPGTSGPQPLALADLNRDGKLDLMVGGSQGINVLFGNGDGTFSDPRALPIYQGRPDYSVSRPSFINTMFAGDLNSDGFVDIVLDNTIFSGNGDGTFRAAQYLVSPGGNPTLVYAGDLTGDGRVDLVFLNTLDNSGIGTTLSVLINDRSNVPVIGYSAASGGTMVAPGSFGSIYGKSLARQTATAAVAVLPTQLGGISLRIVDSLGTLRLAPLYYVSPTQINFLVPSDSATGLAVLSIDDGSAAPQNSANATVINDVAPGFFVANGIPAATAVRALANGSVESVPVFTCIGAACALSPINTSGGTVFLTLYGSGFRAAKASMQRSNNCTVGGMKANVQFAGPQPSIQGLDQINIQLPAVLPHGMVTIDCGFPGLASTLYPFIPAIPTGPTDGLWHANTVQISIQ